MLTIDKKNLLINIVMIFGEKHSLFKVVAR
jgi:hypothetical protein